jgi:hypothetical protein
MKDFTTGVQFILGDLVVELSEQGSPYQIFLSRAAASFLVICRKSPQIVFVRHCLVWYYGIKSYEC